MAFYYCIENITLEEYKDIVNDAYGFDITDNQKIEDNFLKAYNTMNSKYVLYQRSPNSKIKKICRYTSFCGIDICRCENPSTIELSIFETHKTTEIDIEKLKRW